jgi:hypothetical protein
VEWAVRGILSLERLQRAIEDGDGEVRGKEEGEGEGRKKCEAMHVNDITKSWKILRGSVVLTELTEPGNGVYMVPTSYE